MKVQVMTIQTVQKSSKSELSSRGKGPFKVFVILRFWLFFCRHRYMGLNLFKELAQMSLELLELLLLLLLLLLLHVFNHVLLRAPREISAHPEKATPPQLQTTFE